MAHCIMSDTWLTDVSQVSYLIGQLLNEGVNFGLKHWIKEPRPVSTTTPQMRFDHYVWPCGHSQFMAFLCAYMTPFVLIRLRLSSSNGHFWWILKVFALIGLFASTCIVCVGRVYLGQHSERQVRLSGSAIGLFLDIARFLVVHILLTAGYMHVGDRKKPLMLFLHGFPEFWYSWRHQMREFSDDYWCVAVDMRGYESDKPSDVSQYGVKWLSQDVKELVDALGYSSCVLVAHDWGGAVAWNVAMYYPEVDKLIVMNCPHPVAFARTFTSNVPMFDDLLVPVCTSAAHKLSPVIVEMHEQRIREFMEHAQRYRTVRERLQCLDAKRPVDDNGATHVMRHAVGGSTATSQYRKLYASLSVPSDMARDHRDDISIVVVYFEAVIGQRREFDPLQKQQQVGDQFIIFGGQPFSVFTLLSNK